MSLHFLNRSQLLHWGRGGGAADKEAWFQGENKSKACSRSTESASTGSIGYAYWIIMGLPDVQPT